jgi:hypothetical protein
MGEMNTTNNLSDDAFARLVAEEVKNKVSRTQRNILLQKENWDKWRRALQSLLDHLNEQLTNIEGWEAADTERYEAMGSDGMVLLASALAEYKSRKTKIDRFRFHVERRLDDVMQMISTGEAPEDDLSKHARLFENAIRKHKELLDRFDIEPNAIDLALWDALDGRWTFNEVKAADVMSE